MASESAAWVLEVTWGGTESPPCHAKPCQQALSLHDG